MSPVPDVRCPRCNGLTQGTIVADNKVCGALPPGGAPEQAPRTQCLGMADFTKRVGALLHKIAECERCPICGANGVPCEADCAVIALLRECVA